MTCEEFELRLDETLHRREPLDLARFAAHLDRCTGCRRAFDGAKLLSDAIAASRTSEPRVDLADRVLQWHTAEVRRNTGATWSVGAKVRHAAIVAFSAAVVVFVTLFMTTQPTPPPVARDVPGPKPKVIDEPKVVQSPLPEDGPVLEEPPPVEELVASARSAYLALAQDAAHTLRDAAAVIVPEKAAVPTLDALPKPPKLDVWQPTLPEGLGEWLDRRG